MIRTGAAPSDTVFEPSTAEPNADSPDSPASQSGPTGSQEASPSPAWRVLSVIGRAGQNMFGLDRRSVAMLRISVALCLLWVIYANGSELGAFYTDDGVLSRDFLIHHPIDFLGFSLHLAYGGTTYIAILFVIQAALAVMMLVGYRTTFATVGCYILLLSMQNRNPVLMFGADIVLRIGLFWMMFLPLAQRFSVDAIVGRARPAPTSTYVGIAGIAFIAQIFLIYIIGSLMKVGPSWVSDHSAVSHALSLDVYSRPLGQWLNQFHGLTRALTVFTLYAERYGPLLFILPVWSPWGRALGLVLFTGLQASFGLTMTMGIFGPLMVSLTLVFLPPEFWTRVAEPLGRRLVTSASGVRTWWSGRPGEWWRHLRDRERTAIETGLVPPRWRPAATYTRRGLHLLRDCVVLGLLVLTIVWNIDHVPGRPPRLSQERNLFLYAVGLNQVFDMFAPNPHTTDGWFVVAGTLRNGKVVDILNSADPAVFDKPASVARSYGSMLWMSQLISFWSPNTSSLDASARYLGRQWNERHSEAEQLERIEITMMGYETGAYGAHTPVVQTSLWTEPF